ncbi:hypothetical protein JI666_14025 [Bacillus sp. NTK071]|uniref:hypothetical protein n=1 Tax=Bacillus sp. NTK071 TaxID=2802175 RepID=UPI001A8FDA1F|nr:hypothetical protein [Bacillus sp. NTK071]MBN8209869.1 hypothetical protein [Bacillus sp. NTK071]
MDNQRNTRKIIICSVGFSVLCKQLNQQNRPGDSKANVDSLKEQDEAITRS